MKVYSAHSLDLQNWSLIMRTPRFFLGGGSYSSTEDASQRKTNVYLFQTDYKTKWIAYHLKIANHYLQVSFTVFNKKIYIINIGELFLS